MKTSTIKGLLQSVAICGIATLFVGGSALAAGSTEVIPGKSLTVRYGDLNLANQAGVAALYRRIGGAAKRVCGDTGVRDLLSAKAMEECRRVAIANAVRDVNNTRLTAMHNDHGNKQRSFG